MLTGAEVTVKLTGSEALVLSDALARWESDGTISAIEPAARRVIADLSAVLERTIDVVFSVDYGDELQRAKDAVLRS